MAHKSKQPNNNDYLTDVEIFNKLMFEYAKIGKTTKINLLFKKMHFISADSTDLITSDVVPISSQTADQEFKPFKIKPNMDSYAAALQSLGYELKILSTTRNIYRVKLQVERILWDMRKANLSIETLANNLLFSSEQQDCIKNALNLVLPNFEFKDHIDFSASSPLMKNLKIKNSLNQSKRNVNNYYPKEMIDKNLIVKNFDKQISFEAKSLTSVPSIMPTDEPSLHEQKYTRELREKILSNFRVAVSRELLKNISILKESDNFQNALIYPFLTFMDHMVYVDLLMQEVIRLSQNSKYFSECTRNISLNLGNTLETKYLHFVMNKNGDVEKVS